MIYNWFNNVIMPLFEGFDGNVVALCLVLFIIALFIRG